jgi:hypothetical protein
MVFELGVSVNGCRRQINRDFPLFDFYLEAKFFLTLSIVQQQELKGF